MKRETPDDSGQAESRKPLFRQEAIEHYLDDSEKGDLLRASPN
jgi:hypothetical protein